MKHSENLVVIHLSATAVYVVVGQIESARDIRIRGIGHVKTYDFQHGYINNREKLNNAIKQAIQQAEDESNCRIHSAWLSLATPELKSYNSQSVVEIEKEVVDASDMYLALTKAKEKVIKPDYYVIRHCQQGIEIRNQDPVSQEMVTNGLMVDDAVGQCADEILVCYHLMSIPVASANNIQRLIQDCNIEIEHILFDAVCSAEYALIPEERQKGVCLIDIGYNTTSVCVYVDNKLLFTRCIDEGGQDVTLDISCDLSISIEDAELLKRYKGTVDTESVDPSAIETCVLKNGGELGISLKRLSAIIYARYFKIYQDIFTILTDEDVLPFVEKIVLSGGGSLMKGMIPFSKKLLNMPVILTNQSPFIKASEDLDKEKFDMVNLKIKDRIYYTAFGALLYSQSEQFNFSQNVLVEPEKPKLFDLSKVYQTLKKFL